MRQFFISTTLALLLTTGSLHGSSVDVETNELIEAAASIRLSEEFIRAAHMAAMSEPLDTVAIKAAVALVIEASKLTPNDPAVWRTMVEVAQMADLPELRTHAIGELLRTAPTQTTVQLARIRDYIEGTNTVAQRMGVYEQLLSGDQSAKLDPRVAARIAFDAAMLQRQNGDITQFSRWLAEAVALDPAYPDAISMAAGFFGDETAEAHQRAELLASAVLSNIRDITTQVALAEFLMAYGDFEDAQGIYEVLMGDNAGNDAVISNGLLADIVLSQWAAGDVIAAMNTILARQKTVDERNRRIIRMDQPRLTPLELARIHAPLVPKLAVVRAAMYVEFRDSDEAAAAVDSALESIRAMSSVYEAQGGAAMTKAVDLFLQAAWIALWLGDDVDIAKTIIDRAQQIAPLDPNDAKKFEGWIAYRQGDIETAKAILSTLSADPMARVGMGLIHLDEGNRKAAAMEFLNVARIQGGTLLGVWSQKQLRKIVGTDFNLWEETPELQQLMVGVFQTIHAFVSDPRPPIDLKVVPVKDTFAPYEPVIIDIRLTNNTTIPLTIANNGPIQPFILIEPQLEISNLSIQSSQAIIIPIDRELTINPRETLSIQTDLRQQWLGGMLNAFPLRGASLQVSSKINFVTRETRKNSGEKILVYELGRLGQRNKTELFRLDGVRLFDTWLRQAIIQASNIKTIGDLSTLVLLTWAGSDNINISIETPLITPENGDSTETVQGSKRLVLQDDAITTVLTAFPGLGPRSQAWVVATMSGDPSVEAVVRMMKEPESTIAKLVWILRFASTTVPDEVLDDPGLLSALESKDKSVRDVADWVYAWVKMIVKNRLEQQLGIPATEVQ